MESSTSYINKYGRQISDTSFTTDKTKYTNVNHKQRSFSENVDHTHNGSIHSNDNKNDSFYITRKFVGSGSGQPHRKNHGGSSRGNDKTEWNQSDNLRRSENVVRFHKDLVTDIHDDFRDKIQVDELGSKHSITQSGYKSDNIVLQKRPSDAVKINFHPNHQSDEFNSKRRKSSKNRKTSVETDLRNKGHQNSIKSKGVDPWKTNLQNGHVAPKTLQYQGSKEGKAKSRGSSRKRQHSSKGDTNIPNQKQILSVKKSVTQTRSSSSTDSGQSVSKSKRGDTYTLSVDELIKSSVNKNNTNRNGKVYSDRLDVLDLSERNKQHQAKKRKRTLCCVCLSVIVTLVIGAALVTGIVLFIANRGSQEDMLNVHVRLRVLNHNYTRMFDNSSSPHFRKFSVQMCNEVDVVYITSHMSENYFGCRIISLRAGSVQVYYISPFLDSLQTSNTSQHREILLNNLITLFSPNLPVNTTVLGDFLIDANSIEISIEHFKANKLPPKPKMPVRVITTLRPSSTFSITTGDLSSTSQKIKDAIQDSFVKITTANLGQKTSTKSTETTKSFTTKATVTNERTKVTYKTSASQAISTPSTMSSKTTSGVSASTSSKLFTDTTSPLEYIDTTTQIDTTTEDHQISVTVIGDDVILQKEPAEIECIITKSKAVTSIKVTHIAKGSEAILKTVAEGELREQRDYTSVLSRTKKLSIKFDTTSIHLRLYFSTVSCKDVGIYSCAVENTDSEVIRGNGYLNGTAIPGMPQLTLPIALIENKETRQPIMCTADVGFPNGKILWKVKPKGFTEFLPFDGHFTSKSGDCDRFVTSSLIYTPTKEGNGTVLKCEVSNELVFHSEDLSVVTDLYILPENLCIGVPVNKSIRHPSTCTKYIRCNRNRFKVKECDNRMCYDEETDRCGKTQLTMNDVTAYLNEGVTSLQCRLNHLGVWNNVTISKLLSDGKAQPIVTVKSRGKQISVYDSDMKDRIFVHQESPQDFEIKINIWVYALTCADEGVYKCWAYTPSEFHEVTAQLELRGKPDAPSMSIPNEIIEGIPLRKNITCQANVGYPEGRLLLTMQSQSGAEFKPVNLNITTEKIVHNCSKLVRKSFTFTPTLYNEKMKIVCEVENNFTLPFNRKLIAMETLHVIPKNFCSIRGTATPQVHPHDCHQYIQCSEGYTYVQRCGSDHCFNPLTLHCDLEVEDKQEPFDPKHPCLPDKNGVFFPHPILCNKYIWCVQGQEVVHHCPLGTLYIDGGQCTFEPEKSRCYQEQNKNNF